MSCCTARFAAASDVAANFGPPRALNGSASAAHWEVRDPRSGLDVLVEPCRTGDATVVLPGGDADRCSDRLYTVGSHPSLLPTARLTSPAKPAFAANGNYQIEVSLGSFDLDDSARVGIAPSALPSATLPLASGYCRVEWTQPPGLPLRPQSLRPRPAPAPQSRSWPPKPPRPSAATPCQQRSPANQSLHIRVANSSSFQVRLNDDPTPDIQVSDFDFANGLLALCTSNLAGASFFSVSVVALTALSTFNLPPPAPAAANYSAPCRFFHFQQCYAEDLQALPVAPPARLRARRLGERGARNLNPTSSQIRPGVRVCAISRRAGEGRGRFPEGGNEGNFGNCNWK